MASLLVAAAGCGAGSWDEAAVGEGQCSLLQSSIPLPLEIRESSGVAASRQHPGIFWTHNDAGSDPALFAIDSVGGLIARIELGGAAISDWEDVAVGPCPAGHCLYVADIGDNDSQRRDVEVHRIPEPRPGSGRVATPEVFRLRYPDGPRDAEALFVLPSGEVYIISKTGQGPAVLYRVPGSLRAGGPVATLERVREFHLGPEDLREPATGADASPDGRWVAVRGNNALVVYATRDLLDAPDPQPIGVDLRPVAEPQGEGVAIADDGAVFLTSEAGSSHLAATAARLACSLP